MKKLLVTLALLLSCFSTTIFAKDGFKLKLKFTDLTDSSVQLVHYYAQPLPKIYKTTSGNLNSKGEITFKSDTAIIGGIYIILLSDNATYFEFLLDNGDDMEITVTKSKLPQGISFKNSKPNDDFLKYVNFLQEFAKKDKALQSELENAKTPVDTAAIREKSKSVSKELTDYRRNYRAANPNTLLASIFGALEIPQVPEGPHYKADGKTIDSNFSYHYYKGHYWDNFNFKDDRLIYTPIYDAKLEEYFTKLVLPTPDSMNKESDWILAKVKGQKELFKYTLWWLTKNAESSKVMGMDQVFVYLVENYYMKGAAYWLDSETLQKYIDRSQKIAPNVLGNLAPDLKLKDVNGVEQQLSKIKARYTILAFYSPDCGHCKQEMPKVDSVYRAALKAKGAKVYAVATEDEPKWKDFIKEYKIQDWINVADWQRTSDFRSKYDIYSTPVIYVLDENKIIIGKRLDHSNILSVIEHHEKVQKEKNNK